MKKKSSKKEIKFAILLQSLYLLIRPTKKNGPSSKFIGIFEDYSFPLMIIHKKA